MFIGIKRLFIWPEHCTLPSKTFYCNNGTILHLHLCQTLYMHCIRAVPNLKKSWSTESCLFFRPIDWSTFLSVYFSKYRHTLRVLLKSTICLELVWCLKLTVWWNKTNASRWHQRSWLPEEKNLTQLFSSRSCWLLQILPLLSWSCR